MHDSIDAAETASTSSAPGAPGSTPASQRAPTAAREWVCSGVPYRRRVLTGLGVILAAALFVFLAIWQGATMLVSSIIGAIFIGGFIAYLWIVAPTPFMLRVDAEGLDRSERGREPVRIIWPNVVKVKEERFKSGKSVSLTVYKRVGERGLHRAFVVYRDDIPDFDGFLAALRAGVPPERPWIVETVHE